MTVTLKNRYNDEIIEVENVVEIFPDAELFGNTGIQMGVKDPGKAWVEYGLWQTFDLIKVEA